MNELLEEKRNNTISIIFKVLACMVFIGGFIAGLIAGFVFARTLLVTLIYWASGFISGIVFLGFSEIIQLLYEIKNSIKKNSERDFDTKNRINGFRYQ